MAYAKRVGSACQFWKAGLPCERLSLSTLRVGKAGRHRGRTDSVVKLAGLCAEHAEHSTNETRTSHKRKSCLEHQPPRQKTTDGEFQPSRS